MSFEEVPNYDFLRKEIRNSMDQNGFLFDFLFDWDMHSCIENELTEISSCLETQANMLVRLKSDEEKLMNFMQFDIMSEYDFREMRKTLLPMFSFDEINLLDDEIGEEARNEMEKDKWK